MKTWECRELTGEEAMAECKQIYDSIGKVYVKFKDGSTKQIHVNQLDGLIRDNQLVRCDE